MPRVTVDYTAFNYGYTSPKIRGRVDLDFYDQSLDYLKNYIVTPQGELQYRAGGVYVAATRGNKVARLIPFKYNTEQAYQIELTDLKMRFYKDHGLIVEAPKTITAITKAAAAQLTIAGHGLLVGDPLIIDGVSGMVEINGLEAAVASVVDANNITVNINSNTFTTYTSGGTASKIVEVTTPYPEAELFKVDYAQTNDTMYITHASYQPRKLTRSSHTAWTLATYTIQGNPFGTTKAVGQSITAVTKAFPAVVTYSGSDTYANGDTVFISGIVGMTELNNKNFTVQKVNTATNTLELAGVDSSAYAAYTSGGTIEEYTAFDWPSLVAFFEQRIVFAASNTWPRRLWFSNTDPAKATVPYDNFNTGTLDTDGIVYNLAGDQANRIRWLAGTEDYLAIGTSGSEHKASGGGNNDALTATNISSKPVSFNGSLQIKPVRLDSYVIYNQRNGKTIRSFEYNALQDGYTSPDRTLLADHILKSKAKDMAFSASNPPITWIVRNDGIMVGLTFDPAQQIVAWHPHDTQGKYLSVSVIPEADEDDEVWYVVERTINGVTKRFVEYFPNNIDLPIPEDYFTGTQNQTSDMTLWEDEFWDAQRRQVHADSALVYDGSELATVGLTFSALTGEGITCTASAGYFNAGMVNRYIQTPRGVIFKITGYTSTTVVTGDILYGPLEALTFASGGWYMCASTIQGINHLNGMEVVIWADGGTVDPQTVTAGTITLDAPAGYVVIGLAYNGIGKTQSLEGGAAVGRSQGKPRTVSKAAVRFRNSLGTKFGKSLYKLEESQWRVSGERAGRAPRLYDGTMPIQISDDWSEDKNIYWLHNDPCPSNIQLLTLWTTTND